MFLSKVPEGHHPRGTTLRDALRGNLRLRELSGVSQRALRGLSEGSAGLSGNSAGLCGGLRDSPRFSVVVTLCLRPSGTVRFLFPGLPIGDEIITYYILRR